MKQVTAVITAFLIFGSSTASAAGGQGAFIQSLGDIQSSLRLAPPMKVLPGGRARFIPAEFRKPVKTKFLEQLNRDRRAVYKMALPAILSVRAGGAQGSGFIVDPKGIVVTNCHVVCGAMDNVVVETFNGKKYPATVLAAAPGRDIAILQIDFSKDWPALRLISAKWMQEGDIVFALGNPVGLGISFSQGTVSRRNQSTVNFWVDYIQSDIQISQGNSGGPLLDLRGRVIGMNTAMTGTAGKIGLAIKSDDIAAAIREYAKEGKLVDGYAEFGVIETSGPDTEPTAVVSRVKPGSEADKAGLKVGDSIVSYDGRKVQKGEKNQFQIFRSFGRKKPGEKVVLEVRSGKKVKVGFGTPLIDAHLSGTEGVVLLGSGYRQFLSMIMRFGAQANVYIDGGDALELETILIAPNGSFAVFQIKDEAKREVSAAGTHRVEVVVEEFTSEDLSAEESE